LRYTLHPFRLIFINDASTDGTSAYLAGIITRHKDSLLIQNPHNLGYGASCNRALPYINTPYFCLLNNDVVVTKDWLASLVSEFERQKNLGQLSPNSNSIISEKRASLAVSYKKWKAFYQTHQHLPPHQQLKHYYGNIAHFAQKVKENYLHPWQKIHSPPMFLGGWCVLMKTSILPHIGNYLFDERFYKAFYEDVDLSWRIGLAGYAIGILRSVYLHHFGSVTFYSLSQQEQEKAKLNRMVFIKKWADFILNHLEDKYPNHLWKRMFSRKEVLAVMRH
jgi:GT2 family glycosyltransferase